MADTPTDKDTHEKQDLLSRLTSYTIVNSMYQQYENLKTVSPFIKAGLETAENTTQKLVTLAQPVLQPVINKLDSSLHLEDAANKVLDKTEEFGNTVASVYQIGVVQSENLKDAVTHNIEKTKEAVAQTVQQGSDLVNQTLAYTNKPINQLLDVTESIVNNILPPELELEPLDIHEDIPEPISENTPVPENVHAERRLEENPLPRIRQLGGGVSKRVKRVALSKLSNLSLRTPSQENSFAYVVDLIQYTAEYIDIDKKTQALKDATSNIQQYFEEKKVQAAKYINPTREVIEKHTADIKEQSVKTIVSIVSSIAHATEVVRRQLIGQAPDLSVLQANLAQITDRTKASILQLKEPQLSEYMAYVRSTYTTAVESLLQLTYAYTPASLSDLLQSWSASLHSRLALNEKKKDAKDGEGEDQPQQSPVVVHQPQQSPVVVHQPQQSPVVVHQSPVDVHQDTPANSSN